MPRFLLLSIRYFYKTLLHYYNPDSDNLDKLVELKVGVIGPADEGGDNLSFPIGYLVLNKIYILEMIYNNAEMIYSKKLNYVAIEGNSAWKFFAKRSEPGYKTSPHW